MGQTSGLVVTFGNQGSTTVTGVSITCTGGNGFVGFTSPTTYQAQHDPEIPGQNENAVRLHRRPTLCPELDILKTALMSCILLMAMLGAGLWPEGAGGGLRVFHVHGNWDGRCQDAVRDEHARDGDGHLCTGPQDDGSLKQLSRRGMYGQNPSVARIFPVLLSSCSYVPVS